MFVEELLNTKRLLLNYRSHYLLTQIRTKSGLNKRNRAGHLDFQNRCPNSPVHQLQAKQESDDFCVLKKYRQKCKPISQVARVTLEGRKINTKIFEQDIARIKMLKIQRTLKIIDYRIVASLEFALKPNRQNGCSFFVFVEFFSDTLV